MSRILCTVNHPTLTDSVLTTMAPTLIRVIAQELDTSLQDGPMARVDSEAVALRFLRPGPLDQQMPACVIEIVANSFPFRTRQRKRITDAIMARLLRLDVFPAEMLASLPIHERVHQRPFVWLQLHDGAYTRC